MQPENQLLHWLIKNPAWIEKTQPDIFNSDHQRIFYLAKRTLEANKPISFQQLEYVLNKGNKLTELELIRSIQNQPEIDKATALEIRTELRQQAFTRLSQAMANLDLSDPKAQKQFMERLINLTHDNQPKTINDPVNFKNWSRHIVSESSIIPSGIPFLEGTGTDFKAGDLITLMAPSGEFKTGTLSHIIKHNITSGRNVLVYSFEDTDATLLNRIGHGLLAITPWQYKQLSAAELELRFQTKFSNLGELICITGAQVVVEDMESQIEELEERLGFQFDMILIDYSAQLVTNSLGKNAREDQAVAAIFRSLKLLATNKQRNRCVITAQQTNRTAYRPGRSASLEASASGMGGVHASDLVISNRYKVNPEAPHRATPADEQPDDVKGYVKMTVMKSRGGVIAKGSTFIYDHTANGNMRHPRRTYEEAKVEWDNLFELDPQDVQS